MLSVPLNNKWVQHAIDDIYEVIHVPEGYQKLAQKTKVPYQVLATLEAATCILAGYFRSQNHLFSDRGSPWEIFTRCQKKLQGFQAGVRNVK